MLSFANHASQTSAATYASMLSFATYASILSFATDVSVFAVAVRYLCVHAFLGHLRVHTLFCHRILRPCVCNGKHDYFSEDPLKTFCSVYKKKVEQIHIVADIRDQSDGYDHGARILLLLY